MGYKNLPVMSIEEFYEDRARKVDNIQDLKAQEYQSRFAVRNSEKSS